MNVIDCSNNEGFHNQNLENSNCRLLQSNTYKDLSTICIIPTRGLIHARVLQSWFGLILPMNQKFTRIFVTRTEIGEAYNNAILSILNHPELSQWKYVLTLEEDNLPPPDGLLKLYESIEKYDVVGGLYWTKGEIGQPMIYGDPNISPKNFIPRIPIPNTLQEANGLGMGFNLFKLDIFKNLEFPWFKTVHEYDPNKGVKLYTQDLFFYEKAGNYGYKFACDTRVKVGHFDYNTEIIW